MNSSVCAIASAATPPARVQTQASHTAVKAPTAVADGIVATAATAPLLTIAATGLAQIIPGVVEAEGATAIATAIGIGARAALEKPVLAIAAGALGTTAFGYAKSLVHDAFAATPGLQPLAHAANSLNADIHAGLGIPLDGDR